MSCGIMGRINIDSSQSDPMKCDHLSSRTILHNHDYEGELLNPSSVTALSLHACLTHNTNSNLSNSRQTH